jgi:hypothetical protein
VPACRGEAQSCYNKEHARDGNYHIPGYTGHVQRGQHVSGRTFANATRASGLGEAERGPKEIVRTGSSQLPPSPTHQKWHRGGAFALGQPTNHSLPY